MSMHCVHGKAKNHALDPRSHELRETLQRPDDVVHLADALLGVLTARAQVQRGPVLGVVAPDHHLSRHSLRWPSALVSERGMLADYSGTRTSGSTCEAVTAS